MIKRGDLRRTLHKLLCRRRSGWTVTELVEATERTQSGVHRALALLEAEKRAHRDRIGKLDVWYGVPS